MGCALGSYLLGGAKVTTVLAWWFEPPDGVLANGDARKPKVGVLHTVDRPLELCKAGLHGSVKPLDALQYATSSVIWRTEHSGDVVYGKDKLCSTKRTYLRRLDATEVLRHFARLCALDVIHLWEAPDVVKRYLETGDESLMAAGWDAAWDAGWDVAKDAAWYAARAAARYAARYAARDVARDAGWDAGWDVAWDAAWDAAWDVAKDAGWDAGWYAARYAARDVARAAGWYAAREKQNARLEQMLKDAHEREP